MSHVAFYIEIFTDKIWLTLLVIYEKHFNTDNHSCLSKYLGAPEIKKVVSQSVLSLFPKQLHSQESPGISHRSDLFRNCRRSF